MPILELRILPPVAIGRLGAAAEPLEAFDLVRDPDRPLDYRRIVPCPSFRVDPGSGEIAEVYTPEKIRFRDADRLVRPVAPFLEVFARLAGAPDELVPLTLDLLAAEGLSVADLRWDVAVGNIKVFRRTGNAHDKIEAAVNDLDDHAAHALEGRCDYFLPGRVLPLGQIQFIRPTAAFPQIRLRFTPAGGHVYGSALTRQTGPDQFETDPVITTAEQVLYDAARGDWRGYFDTGVAGETNPGSIYAGWDTPTDAQGNSYHVSWGYLDDECDGTVTVKLRCGDQVLSAQAVIGAGPPAYAPDTLPVRVVSDEVEQILFGATADEDSISLDDAAELVFRALETVRLMNTAVMNGNPVNGRLNVASTMVRQNSSDFERFYEPIAASSLVDNLALRALHERVFAGLAARGLPWFAQAMRQPEEIGDLSSATLRKMPALMRGADGRSLTLTRRHIDMVTKAAQRVLNGPDGASQGKS
ncbi:hypothetical protein [Paracidovorax konjaci]|uniref:Uncharacterized protein n=1 Tax=Paracidovorax konjaci TaxID=32040 RepID=A0A1I1RR80_9BURK|nr:hypothetical protein [Paracidovorax konjaci]SFD36849.1 hypothetical protein SAMN04489710_101326 [Paracidovorax konjaci]